jgi:Putative addiction module component
MSMPGIDQMSWEEKLRALEELWDAITREGDRYRSPAWHKQELKETQQRFDVGAVITASFTEHLNATIPRS